MRAMTQRRRALIAAAAASRLPSAYQEVEYLRSDGGAGINTGVYGSRYLSANVRFRSNNPATVLGGRDASWSSSYVIMALWADSVLRFDLADDATRFTLSSPANQWIDAGITPTVYSSYSVMKCSVQIRGTTYTANQTVSTFTTPVAISLFGMTQTSGHEDPAAGRKLDIAAASLYDNGVLIRDFVPCYRKSDSKPGMYDLVNNVFYTNCWVNEFVIGPNV